MIPILYSPSERKFNTNGIGRLTGATSCIVVEEKNGEFELEMEISISSPFYGSIQLGSVIGVTTCRNGKIQGFDVYSIEKKDDFTAVINAAHVSYRSAYIPIKPFSATGASNSINSIASHVAVDSPFTLSTDLDDTSKKFDISVPKTMRACLSGDDDDSFVGVFEGELEYDNFSIKVLKNRGKDNGVELRRGKNITELSSKSTTENMVTGVLPYWADGNDSNVALGDVQYAEGHEKWENEHILPLDLSSEFDSKPTSSQLNSKAIDYLKDNSETKIEDTIELSFVDLTHTEEYKDIAPLEAVSLCDTVRVVYPQLGISYKTKVIHLEWDVLAEETSKIKLGDPEKSIINLMSDNTSDIDYITDENTKLVSKVDKVEEDVGDAVVKIDETATKVDNMEDTVININGDVTSLESRVEQNEETVKQVNSYFTFKGNGLEISTNNSNIKTVYSADGFSIVDSNTGTVLAKATSGRFNCSNGLGVNDWAIEQHGNALNIFRKK
ncbi:MAG: phage tail spike protein [Erysipelotrichia bacterium]|nr:phage tail spike protein [Erysipelotrichia bacterium]